MSCHQSSPLLLLLLAAAPGPRLAAQSPEVSGTYRIYQGALEVSRETFHGTARTFDQTVVIPTLHLRLQGHAARDSAGRFAGFSLQVMTESGDSLRGKYDATVTGDSVRIASTIPRAPGDKTRPANFDVVIPPQSVAVIADLVRRSAGADSTWRVLLPGPDTVLAATVRFTADTARVGFAGIQVVAVWTGGKVVSLEIPAQRARAILAEPGESLPPLAGLARPKPDYSAPAGAPYTAQEVRVPVAPAAADTFSLGCTLMLPAAGRPPFPAAVTITGSGSQDRDEELWPTLPGYRPFRQIAERLAAAGIATLRCDDRGRDASTGDASRATTADLAGDTRAQVAWLRQRKDIDGRRIALVGHSEGGMIGPLLAAEDRRLAALVVMAGPAKPGARILIDQAEWPVRRDTTLTPEQRQARLAQADSSVLADSAAQGEWFQWFYHYDPLPTAARVTQPTLILHGALDRQVSVGQADSLAAAMRRGGNQAVTVRVFPGLNHLFLPSPTDGSPSEYPSLRQVAIPDAVLDTLAEWLRGRLRGRG